MSHLLSRVCESFALDVWGYTCNWRMFIGYAFKFFNKAAGLSVDVSWLI